MKMDSMNDKYKDEIRSGGVFVNLPVLNEREIILRLLTDIHQELKEVPHTVCIVDDGSTDGTIDLIEDFARQHGGVKLIRNKKEGRGCKRGNALRVATLWGLEHTEHQHFVEMDGDYSHDPRELKIGLNMLTDHDVVIGSKYRESSLQTAREPLRKVVSKAATVMLKAMYQIPISDLTNGYRFYTRECARALSRFNTRYSSPAYLMEALSLWDHEGYRIGDFATSYHGREMGTSKVIFTDFIRGFLSMIEIKLRFTYLSRR